MMQVSEANVFRVGKQPENEGALTWTDDARRDVSTMSIMYRGIVCCPYMESFHGPPFMSLRSISHSQQRLVYAL